MPTSLRQRRSRSPTANRQNGQHHPTTTSNTGKEDKGQTSSSISSILTLLTTSPLFQSRIGLAALAILAPIILAAVLFVVFWCLRFTNLYNPDAASCTIPTFDYPWCPDNFLHDGKPPPPLTPQEWLQWRQWYLEALETVAATSPNKNDNEKPPLKSSFKEGWDQLGTVGFNSEFPLELQTVPGKGRGLFATTLIPKGSKIWDSRYRAVFPNECVARHFFQHLSNRQKCDAMFWGYANNFYGYGSQYMLDLDGHGYTNHAETSKVNARHHFETELDTNDYRVSRFFSSQQLTPQQRAARNKPGAYGLYALRDIQPGEEIVYNYGEIFTMGFVDWYTMLATHSLPFWKWNYL